jgi:hypothetical protein
MSERRDGILALDSFNFGNSRTVVIAVHPYYPFLHSKDEGVKAPERFVERFDRLVETHSGPLITFEGEPRWDQTIVRYLSRGRKEDRYLVKTVDGGIELRDTNWEQFFDF